MAEKISAARAPSAGEKRFCSTVLACDRASMASAMASYSSCRAVSCSCFCASWASRSLERSSARMRPVRVSNRVRSCASSACVRANSAAASSRESAGRWIELSAAGCSGSCTRRASRYRAASRAVCRASASAVLRRRASDRASCMPDRSAAAGAKTRTWVSRSRSRRRQASSLSAAETSARRAASAASSACCRRGRYSAIWASSAARCVSAYLCRSTMA